MFPVRSFQESSDDDSLPSIPGSNRLFKDDDDDDDLSINSSDSSFRNLNPLRSNTRAAYSDIYKSTTNHIHHGAGSLNLQDLEAYVKETVRAQRQQRRKDATVKCVWLVLGAMLALWMVQGALSMGRVATERDDAKSDAALGSHGKYHYDTTGTSTAHGMDGDDDTSSVLVLPKYQTPDGYVLSQCEELLNHNKSFVEMIQETQELISLPACRPEVPDCDWENPTIPAPRQDPNSAVTAEWKFAFEYNKRHIQGSSSQKIHKHLATGGQGLDVVMIGDSIVEHWEGKDMGMNEPSLHRDRAVFEQLFTRRGGGQIEGMAHGIGGDRCSNLLYRLQHGEMPSDFRPRVWWVLVGTEDWRVGVDSSAVVAGIVKIVLTIRHAHPTAHIVVNSILPRGNEKRNNNPHYAALHDINHRLECFVESENARQAAVEQHDQHLDQEEVTALLEEPPLSFFNATSIFLFHDPEVGYFVNPALMPDYVHPSPQGEELWGRQIVQTVLELTTTTGTAPAANTNTTTHNSGPEKNDPST